MMAWLPARQHDILCHDDEWVARHGTMISGAQAIYGLTPPARWARFSSRPLPISASRPEMKLAFHALMGGRSRGYIAHAAHKLSAAHHGEQVPR